MTEGLASWNQRHRLRQGEGDARRGVFNPHHSVLAFRLDGRVEVAALDRAWRGVQARHPVLLSSFDGDRWRSGRDAEPVGLVEAGAGIGIGGVEAVATAPFDLARGPLARLVLAPDVLVLVLEHLITDGWSRSVLVRDLGALYAREIGHEPAALPVIGQDYFDFTQGQNAYLESARGLALRARLARELADLGPAPSTPLNAATGLGAAGPAPVRHERNRWARFALPAEHYDRLAPLAGRTGVSRLNIALGALHTALSALSGLPEVATTVTVANRARPAVQQSVGWFASKVVVRSAPGGLADPEGYLRGLRAAVAGAIDASRVPWPVVIHDLTDWFGGQARTPFASFNARPGSMARAELVLPGVAATELDVHAGWQDAALATSWQEAGDLRVSVNYKTDWFGEADVERVWERVDAVLRGLGEDR
ncbi:condensation domain-containing protein [Actinosynnema pretiosum]|uniref:Condensation domain-containing protein n=1 Tax=Actinosynnema pretiosum TaxID=42197 RepID=A0A290Z6U8_9PSEU|nr:condensation domain-containing protein [Actinosynnema pretiosum]ATE54757.1 hypothetical protein CNX65_16930 [Actinosynnema pretiosum]